MNDKPETKIGYVSPLKRLCMTIGELPTSYLETMSYYEMLIWFTKFLQEKVIPTIDNNAQAVEELQQLFIELQSYVNNYFDNLDVQEEINNKLDDMAESGQLADIIAQYLGLAGMITFDNVSDMKLAENLVNGSKCRTLGFRTYNDGGGAFYKIRNITNADTIDEITLIAVYDELLVAELITPDYINPEMAGAYGDGTHDDTDVIKAILSKFDNICFSKIYKVTDTLGSITNKHLFGGGIIQTYIDDKIFNRVERCIIENLNFYNNNTNVDEDSIRLGSVADTLYNSKIDKCYFEWYEYIAINVFNVSNIINSRFLYCSKYFVVVLTDSIVQNNYINGSKTAVARTFMIRSSINNSSFSNNFCDYWKHCFRLRAGSRSSQIVGNTFDDCYSVFQDYICGLTIVGNTFSNIKYVSDNWGSFLPPQEMQEGVWSIFKFDGSTSVYESENIVQTLQDVTFTANLARNCSYYIYRANDNKSLYLYGKCIFNNNIMFNCLVGEYLKFAVTTNMWNNHLTEAPYFDFWDGKEYTNLPNPAITASSGVYSYDKMRCFVSGEEYINIAGTWNKYTITSV